MKKIARSSARSVSSASSTFLPFAALNTTLLFLYLLLLLLLLLYCCCCRWGPTEKLGLDESWVDVTQVRH
jgi:hypothetical protein